MKRRRFLSLIGAASAAPFLPVGAAASSAAASYNRYMYGLAVFHARTRATISTADIGARLRVSAVTAEAMISEMSLRGALVPAMNAGAGTMRAVSLNGQTPINAGRLARKAIEELVGPDDPEEATENETVGDVLIDDAHTERSGVTH